MGGERGGELQVLVGKQQRSDGGVHAGDNREDERNPSICQETSHIDINKCLIRKGHSHDSSICFSPHYEAKWVRQIFCSVEKVVGISFFPDIIGWELNFIPWRRWIFYLEKKLSVPFGNSVNVLHTLKRTV